MFREIQVYFNHTKRLLPNDPRGNLWLDLESQEGRRVHQDWVTDVREINPFLLSYHVTVNYAETEDLEAPAHQCKNMLDLEVAMRPNTWIEPAVIFKLMNINMRPPLLTLCSPLSSVCCEEFLSGLFVIQSIRFNLTDKVEAAFVCLLMSFEKFIHLKTFMRPC